MRDGTKAFWAAVLFTLAVLVLLLVFILENSKHVAVTFLGATGHLQLGVALLIAAVIGALVVVLAVAARVLQLRRREKTNRAS